MFAYKRKKRARFSWCRTECGNVTGAEGHGLMYCSRNVQYRCILVKSKREFPKVYIKKRLKEGIVQQKHSFGNCLKSQAVVAL